MVAGRWEGRKGLPLYKRKLLGGQPGAEAGRARFGRGEIDGCREGEREGGVGSGEGGLDAGSGDKGDE
jgi:hypothetical protein